MIVGYDRVQLKRDVKQAMRETRPRPMLVALLFSVIVSVGTGLINGILGRLLTGGMEDYSTMLAYYIQRGYAVDEAVEQIVLDLMSRGPGVMAAAGVGGIVVSILVSLWQGTMNVGYEGYALSMVRRENPDTGRIFCAFPRIGGVLVTRILVGVFTALWSLLLCLGLLMVMFVAVAVDVPVLSALLVIVATVAMCLGIIWVTMRYALADYALLDQDLSGMDAVRESKRLMQGNTGKAFVLQLSFFGWYLLLFAIIYLGIFLAVIPVLASLGANSSGGVVASAGLALLTVGAAVIGGSVLMLWLRPYETGAMAEFYDWAKADADGASGGAGRGAAPGGWGGPTDYTWNAGSSGPGAGSGSGGGSASGFTITGTGSGHQVGMSQRGAKAMAEAGYDYREILEFYYTDITVE